MSENPLQLLFKTYEKVSNSIQSQLAHFISVPKPPSSHNDDHSFSLVLSSSSSTNLPPSKSPTSQHSELPKQEKNAGPVTKEDLGRATWTFLHTLGAQYPDKPTRQQKRDVKELMAILSRMYPCKECADHFKEVLRANPVQAGSQAEFSQWLCYMHNVVNRSLNKPIFPCDRVDARWGKLDCEQRACDLQGTDKFWP
ncbi:FAD-linked sulfhydryl oxidase ERV1 [Nicotiana sylvestris]|uniref:Sulfhydryl oxidase n=1 Tax=Nicotiana sylvestris TaxID=4096 RepID=A0A1U7XBV1_NICSY|nr:PREDICTED: FAD-linked sulfhydryl oxidase ERV1 [Nicotiana sylvestris]XP_016504084.1 PREDICTED: FAD-linked sulfhydryl oxidase ERV1-like [Nicotiana tabacum]